MTAKAKHLRRRSSFHFKGRPLIPDFSIFVASRAASARDNAVAFVTLCRERLTVFGKDLDFDAAVWDVTQATRRRGSSARDHVYFVRNGSGRRLSDVPLSEPFGSFAKSLIRYGHGVRPKRNFSFWMAALRALEHALCLQSPRPSADQTTVDTLQRAVEYLQSRNQPLAAYKISNFLQHIAKFLDDNLLVPIPNQWRHPLPRPVQGPRIGREYEARKRKCLPSRASLEALPIAFNKATAPRDVLVVATAALQLAANPRICETMTLPANSEVVTLKEADEEGRALRWWPAKGNDPRMKWLVPSLADVAERALARILEVTAEARRIARWYVKNPERLYLPHGMEHLRKREFITVAEANLVLGGQRAQSIFRGRTWHRSEGKTWYRFEDLERGVLAMLPDDFPDYDRHVGIGYDSALFVIPRGLLSQAWVEPMRCMFERVSSQHIRDGLGGRREGDSSVFARLGLTEEDGSPIRLNPHSLRHYMNDLASRNDFSGIDEARWAGRTRDQNHHYHHMSDSERVDRLRALYANGDTVPEVLTQLPNHLPVQRSDAVELAAPMILTTEIGFCVRHTLMAPCDMFVDCLFCTEHVCVKGDRKRTAVVRRWLKDQERMLERAKKLMSEEELGSDRWVEHCTKTVERMRQLLSLLEDPGIEDGKVIRLAKGLMPSRLRDAAVAGGFIVENARATSTSLLPEPS